jgi:cyclase
MLRPRIIPCLLVHNGGLVKTVGFKNPKYVGDPLNAVRIFNEKKVDELIVVDIDASVQKREPDYGLIENLAAECRMPLCYGGGVTSADQAQRIVGLGVEKVAISSAAIDDPDLIGRIAEAVGRQSVVVVLDVKRNMLGRYTVCTHNGRVNTKRGPLELAQLLQSKGVGEIVINSIDNDGTMKGYDLGLAQMMRDAIDVPMTVLGGAGTLSDLQAVIATFKIVGAAAGSLFVFKGKYRAVLISYPANEEKRMVLGTHSPHEQSPGVAA